MPITFSHPVAVLPFKNTKLNFTGLVLGSMAPDFTYFFQGSASGHFAHTLPGLFIFCIPISLLFYFLFHYVMKQPLFKLLPSVDQSALKENLKNESLSFSFFLILVLSIIIGVGTHTFWDSFTHSYGYFVQRSEFLQMTVLSLLGKDFTLFKTLQYSGHLLGVPVMAAVYFLSIRKIDTSEFIRKEIIISRVKFVLGFILLGILSATLSAMTIHFLKIDGSFIGTTVVWTLNSMVLILLLYSIVIQFKDVKQFNTLK